ncbi:hypothetical protein GCM10010168_23470 [Actinoplanes ianthinogenes]|uniref:Uncharacterized protein n=1 Tax=Actinoplanes ianthinogenes TaxID=122358 RepID=A0ABN6CRX2_9ACTN|nr:hypothetical protein [Actinoplanes ianthinogenes]BCJ47988.1 hypothetical protein Aiant_86450 [Actinoplanes ianthinogenes]GGR05596.1 hypothetical protein GCM10010168_23470 [Actinoplanes ianthinogenes]
MSWPRWCRTGAALLWEGLIAVGAAHFGAVAPPPTGLRAERLLWGQLGEVERLLPLLAEAGREPG